MNPAGLRDVWWHHRQAAHERDGRLVPQPSLCPPTKGRCHHQLLINSVFCRRGSGDPEEL